MEHSLGEGGVTAMGAVGPEAGGALVALCQSPFCDAWLTEVATAARDTMRIVGNKLGEERREGGREGGGREGGGRERGGREEGGREEGGRREREGGREREREGGREGGGRERD